MMEKRNFFGQQQSLKAKKSLKDIDSVVRCRKERKNQERTSRSFGENPNCVSSHFLN